MDYSQLQEIMSISENENYKNTDISDVVEFKGHSNTIHRFQQGEDHYFILKQSDFSWAHQRFMSARQASSLLRNHTDIISPDYVSIPEGTFQKPTLVYRYLPHSTLDEVWPRLTSSQRNKAIISLGGLLRKMHQISPDRFGLLTEKSSYSSLSSFLTAELQERLKPAMAGEWPDGIPLTNKLLKFVEGISEKKQPSSLVHHDLHLGNVLCKENARGMECIGFLDFEEAKSGCWESDIAKSIVLHHPMFFENGEKHKWINGFGDRLIEGYERDPDPLLLNFFKIYHLLNLGLFSAMNGKTATTSQISDEIYKAEVKLNQF